MKHTIELMVSRDFDYPIGENESLDRKDNYIILTPNT